jgi:hypothetical protein
MGGSVDEKRADARRHVASNRRWRGPNESSPAARARRQLRLRFEGSPPSGIYVSEPTARGHDGVLRGGAWASAGGCALHDGVQGPHSGADEHAGLTTTRETCGCSTTWPTGRTRPRRIGFGSERCTGAMGGKGEAAADRWKRWATPQCGRELISSPSVVASTWRLS